MKGGDLVALHSVATLTETSKPVWVLPTTRVRNQMPTQIIDLDNLVHREAFNRKLPTTTNTDNNIPTSGQRDS